MLPDDLPDAVSLAVLDVCGAPAATARVVERTGARSVAVLGAAGKSGCLSLAAARAAGATELTGLVRNEARGRRPARRRARRPGRRRRRHRPAGRRRRRRRARPTSPSSASTCQGAEHGAILATADGGTVVFFSMATSFSAAALGAEGMAADVTMLVGNGYTPGHAALALELYRSTPGVRAAHRPARARA